MILWSKFTDDFTKFVGEEERKWKVWSHFYNIAVWKIAVKVVEIFLFHCAKFHMKRTKCSMGCHSFPCGSIIIIIMITWVLNRHSNLFYFLSLLIPLYIALSLSLSALHPMFSSFIFNQLHLVCSVSVFARSVTAVHPLCLCSLCNYVQDLWGEKQLGLFANCLMWLTPLPEHHWNALHKSLKYSHLSEQLEQQQHPEWAAMWHL